MRHRDSGRKLNRNSAHRKATLQALTTALFRHEAIKTTLVITVSKSGGTPEPHLGMQQARHRLEASGGDWSGQAVAITMKNSHLDQQAQQEGWLQSFDMFDWVGGRTSITSAVVQISRGASRSLPR